MADSEKITINLSAVDLGRIDLLAEEGFYSNRTDFIRTAIRKEIESHRDVVEKSVTRRALAVGVLAFTRRSLEQYEKKRQKLDINVVGAVHLSRDVTPDLARRTIQSLKVHGILRASPQVKEALGDRIR
jgi:metal-responsive CopG/Arc/MetJ family transcriptional regulator